MQHQNQDLGRSHGHGGLHQAEGLHQERPTVKNKNAHQLGKRNLCKIYIRLMLAFKTRKNSFDSKEVDNWIKNEQVVCTGNHSKD